MAADVILMSVQDETNRATPGTGGTERGRLVRAWPTTATHLRTSRPRSHRKGSARRAFPIRLSLKATWNKPHSLVTGEFLPRFFTFVFLLLLCTSLSHAADQWPQFRGPTGDGRSDAKGLPLAWSETNHVRWKTAIHGRSWSSPVI